MIKVAMWLGLYVLTLGLFNFDVEYSDGLHIKLHSWLRREKGP